MLTLTLGRVNTLTQNTIYALPTGEEVGIYSDVGLEVSNDEAFTTIGSISAGVTVGCSATFVRSTTGTALVNVKKGSGGSGSGGGSVTGNVNATITNTTFNVSSATVTNTSGNPVFTSESVPSSLVTFEFATTATTTDFALVTVGTTARIRLHNAQFLCDVDNSVKVTGRMGFGTANVPTTTGVVLTHPGMNPGTGVDRGGGWPNIIGVGALDEDLRVTFSTPTGGSVRAIITYSTTN